MALVPIRSTLEGYGYQVDYGAGGTITVRDPYSGRTGTISPGSYLNQGGTAMIDPSYIASWLKPASKPTPEPKSTSKPAPSPTRREDTTPQGYGELPQYSFNYEQALRDIMNQMPKYTPRSDEELLKEATQYANLQIDPQIQALNRALEQIRQAAQARQEMINANYAGFQDSVNRLLDERARQATESAIARGGGRSGQVEWLTAQQQAPILDQAAKVEAQKTAALNEIANALGLSETQAAAQMQELEARRGELQSQQLSALRQLEHANATGNWQMAQQATQALAELAMQAKQYDRDYALALLPYYQMTEAERQGQLYDWANLMGEVPGNIPGGASGGAVPLRSYASGLGASIGYDAATGKVIIGNKSFSAAELEAAGGYNQGGHWYLPQSWVDQQLGR